VRIVRLTSVGILLLVAYGLLLDLFEGFELTKSVSSWQLWIAGLLSAGLVAAIIEAAVGSVLKRASADSASQSADVRVAIASCIAGGLAVASLVLARIIR
jgi:hypothetical protein